MQVGNRNDEQHAALDLKDDAIEFLGEIKTESRLVLLAIPDRVFELFIRARMKGEPHTAYVPRI